MRWCTDAFRPGAGAGCPPSPAWSSAFGPCRCDLEVLHPAPADRLHCAAALDTWSTPTRGDKGTSRVTVMPRLSLRLLWSWSRGSSRWHHLEAFGRWEQKDAGVRPADAHHEDLVSTMTERHTAAPATDQTTQQHSDTKPATEQEKKSLLDLSPIQVMGGALAAMTAAGLGSRFSVEGTVVGAALASVIAAVAGGLYTASLRRTSAAVREVIGGRRTQAAGTKGPSAPKSVSKADTSARTSRRRSLVLSSVVGAVAIFALAGGALTMYEAIAGRALSGGSGTTFSQVQQDGSEDRPTDEQFPASTDSAEPSESTDATPTADSSDTPEAESAPTVEPSAEPSVEPSATAESGPSAAAEPPSAAPSQTARTPR